MTTPEVLRTPDERFEGLPGFAFAPHHVTLRGGLRVHHLDEGPPDAPVVLLMHGEPTWSYLYRKVIPPLLAAGYRCVAPDLVGLGRSDKPSDRGAYTYAAHVAWMRELVVEHLDLRAVTLVCQDWGGLIGLRLVAADPDRFARVVTANTGLPTGEGRPTDAFLAWRRYALEAEGFPVGRIVSGGCTTPLPPDVVAAYDAPYPDDRYTAAVRVFPALVPISPDDPEHDANVAAWEVLTRFERPWLCAFSDGDPITRGGERAFLGRVPGTEGQPHTTIAGGGHFLQEDRGEELARVVVDWAGAAG